MRILSLELKNFRNHKSANFDFDEKSTIIVGDNGAGKTNILEAIHLLSTTKSLRAHYDKEMVSHGAGFARAAAKVEDAEGDRFLELVITPNEKFENMSSKKVKMDKVVRSLESFSGIFNTVLFTPHDVEIFTESPSVRRRYINMLLSQVDRGYKRALSEYTKALKQRNRILEKIRDFGRGQDEIEFWTEKILETGKLLQEKRAEFFDFAEIHINKENGHDYEVFYDKSELSEARLEKYREAEIASARTLVGPHRDDFVIKMNRYNLARFGSRGEKRTTVLALKLCEIDFIEKIKGERPVLLLDDIFSELDEEHKLIVTNLVKLQQTILTTADESDIRNGNLVIRL